MDDIVNNKAKHVIRREEIDIGGPVGSKIYNQNIKEFALKKLTWYECQKCKRAYYGGRRDCEREAILEQVINPEDYKCV